MTSYRVALIAAAVTTSLFSSGAALAQNLPAGDGQDTVAATCTMCHGVDVIVASRRPPDEWLEVVSRMVGNGANLSDDQFAAVVKYLSAALGPPSAPASPSPAVAKPAAAEAH
jgi:cytochrome c5